MKHLVLILNILLCVSLSAQDESRTKVLDVPYLLQPNGKTCQSTCLKMMGMFYGFNNIEEIEIEDIYYELNSSNERPNPDTYAWENFKWWANKSFGTNNFTWKITADPFEAYDFIIKKIDDGHPVLMSINFVDDENSRRRTDGHIVLIVGYENYIPLTSTSDFSFICHDPNGQFFPALGSKLWGKKGKYVGGMSLPEGGQDAPGRNIRIDLESLKRNRTDKHNSGKFAILYHK